MFGRRDALTALRYGLGRTALAWRGYVLEELERHLWSRVHDGPALSPAELDSVEMFMVEGTMEKYYAYGIGRLVEQATLDRIHSEARLR
jgi:hypothetical protein